MRIALVVHSSRGESPRESNHQRVWSHLAERLRTRGHDVELVIVGVQPASLIELVDIVEQCLSLDIDADLVVVTSPAMAVIPHPNLAAYWTDPVGECVERPAEVPADADLRRVLDLVRSAPTAHGGSSLQLPLGQWLMHHLVMEACGSSRLKRIAVTSEFVARSIDRLEVSHRSIMVALPEIPRANTWTSTPPSNAFVLPSDFEDDVRVRLAIAAATSIDDPQMRLRVIGNGPSRQVVESETKDQRITFEDAGDGMDLDDTSAVIVTDRLSGLPWSTLRSMGSGVPVVATDDSGAPVELIEHGVSGMVSPPTPSDLGWALRHATSSPRTRWSLGLNARRFIATISWRRLLDELEELSAGRTERIRVATLSTYPIEPMVGGGQRRANFLATSLSLDADVTVLVNTSPTESIRRRHLEPGLEQIEVPKSAAQRSAELDIFHAIGKLPIDDITSGILAAATPAFGAEVTSLTQRSDVVVATQPFLACCVDDNPVPLVYDSQNAEYLLKADMLPDSVGGDWLRAAALSAETAAATRADLITACTQSDLDEILALRPGATEAPATAIVGNGVDTSTMPFRTDSQRAAARAEILTILGLDATERRPMALFIGSWHQPNIRAARLILELAPLRPDWIFVLAGSHTSEFATTELPANVHSLAVFAESLLWPLLAGADVALNPMGSGGGSNLKLFDYLSVGTPILTTPIGARGIDDAASVATLAEGTPSAFAEGLDEISADSVAVARRVDAGRNLVVSMFDWHHLGRRWADAVLGIVDKPSIPRRVKNLEPRPPEFASVNAPPSDTAASAIWLLGQRARKTKPMPQEKTMDPQLREALKKAKDHRFVGRILPEHARLELPKRAVIRLGHAFTNEQLIYNENVIDAVEHLAERVAELEADNRRLKQQLEALGSDAPDHHSP